MLEYAELHNRNPEMSPKELKVWSVLVLRKGRGLAIKSADLSARTGINDRDIRSTIKYLIERHGKPIGSATKKPCGYYIIKDEQEMKEVQRSLTNRAISTLKRAKAYDSNPIRKGWVADVVGQLTLFQKGDN